jgi:ubiquinone/menaquinone biosynthesis C-methylase UbiE
MSWLELPRTPEAEVMSAAEEAEAYASSAAERHLDRIDDTFAAHAARLVVGRPPGVAIDIGCGPGQILRKLAARLPGWRFFGVDHSEAMLARARAAGADSRVEFLRGDANRLAFPDASFDLVMSNSVLHHLARPERLFAEMARVARPGAAILLRDLRRPGRLAYPLHVRWHGRHYSGLMYKLFCDSVRAAYTRGEMARMLRSSALAELVPPPRIFSRGRTHLGFERAME